MREVALDGNVVFEVAGETVEIPVRVSDLAYFHTDANTWVVEPIAYGVHVGPNARDLPLSAIFSVVDVGQVPATP